MFKNSETYQTIAATGPPGNSGFLESVARNRFFFIFF